MSVVYHRQDKTAEDQKYPPLRLFDCLGLTTPFCFFAVAVFFVVVEGLRFLGGGGGSGAGFRTGEERKADGLGIVMVSILIASGIEALTSTRTVQSFPQAVCMQIEEKNAKRIDVSSE